MLARRFTEAGLVDKAAAQWGKAARRSLQRPSAVAERACHVGGDDKELGSKLQYLTELQDLVGQQQDLLVQQSCYREADAAVAALAETRAKVQSEYRRTLFDDLAKAEQKAGGLALLARGGTYRAPALAAAT